MVGAMGLKFIILITASHSHSEVLV